MNKSESQLSEMSLTLWRPREGKLMQIFKRLFTDFTPIKLFKSTNLFAHFKIQSTWWSKSILNNFEELKLECFLFLSYSARVSRTRVVAIVSNSGFRLAADAWHRVYLSMYRRSLSKNKHQLTTSWALVKLAVK